MKKILIIEDEPSTRENLCEILELEGFASHAAANGKTGVAAALSELPDLILCDVTMPELDGHGVLSALRAEPATRQIPFIFLTAKGERQDVREGMNLGADDYLIKPVDVDDLLAAIEARLERSQQQAGFNPDFKSAVPLEKLGLTPRDAEILLWVAQGKSNFETGIILTISATTVKKHLVHIFEKLGVESRNAATLQALEILSSESAR